MMRVGPLVLSLDGKLLRTRRMTKKINVHPEWKILQTLTNGAKLMMRVGPLVLSLDGKLLGQRRMTKKINVHPEWKILQTLTNGAKLMMRVGPLVLSLDGKLLGTRRMTKKINVHPEWKILQTLTNGAKRCFAMKDLGEAAYIFGIKIYRDRSRRLIGLCQSAYIEKILKRFHMENFKCGSIPMQGKLRLNKSQGASNCR
ncbi:hypothetical protein Tco_1365858 [Tanacetum coccineum]